MEKSEQAGVDVASLIETLRKAAKGGNLEAQYRLGLLCANGEAVPLDFVAAAEWLSKAAEQGHTEAMRTLATLYAGGMGVEQDNDKTRQWLMRSAEGGNSAAQCTVAAMYQFGHHGAKVDIKSMLFWYQQAAEQGYATAQFALGKLLSAGELVQRNEEAAFQWLTLAIMSGSKPAQKELAMLTARLDQTTLESYRERMMLAVGQGDG